MAGFVWEPHIKVIGESTRPSSITVAAITGAGWRFIEVPQRVLEKTLAEQYDWVGWRVQDHFRESEGECRLFGRIKGYAYRPRREHSIRFDTEGNLIEGVR